MIAHLPIATVPIAQNLESYSQQLDRIQQRLDILHRATLYDAAQGGEGYYAEFVAELRQEIGVVRDGMLQVVYRTGTDEN